MRLLIIGLILIVSAMTMASDVLGASIGAPGPDNDVASLDFANMKLTLPDKWGKVQLKHGVGYLSEDPDFSESKDWKVTIEQDEILRPSPATTLRLLRVTCNHLTGSGGWDYVLIYCCVKSRLVRIFQKSFHYGVKIQEPNVSEIVFTNGEWLKGDPHCCPSMERVSRYRWNKKAATYLLVESSTHPRKRD